MTVDCKYKITALWFCRPRLDSFILSGGVYPRTPTAALVPFLSVVQLVCACAGKGWKRYFFLHF